MHEKWLTEAPAVYQIKLFLEYFVRARDGLLEDQITDTAVINRFNNLKRAIKLHTTHQYNSTQSQEIFEFVSKTSYSARA